jgi:DNA-binding transcriptional regulator YhcF (GntR family)
MDFRDDKPIYLQIVDIVCEEILSGRWSMSGKIPSVRDLGTTLKVNPHTVLRSYEYLEANKIIENKRGVGFFITLEGSEQILKARRDSFYKDDLPHFFKLLNSLGITIIEVDKLYLEYKNKH